MNIPNTLSLFRIGLIPCYIGLFYMPGRWTNYAAAVVLPPIATDPTPDEFTAVATVPVPPAPNATEPVLLACASRPSATDAMPDDLAESPAAKLLPPDAVVVVPTAVAYVPLAVEV